MAEKRYYWLKLRKDFFNDIAVKKLRRIAGGDTLTIIYLKLMLYTLDTDGCIEFKGIEQTFGEEVALAIDEDPTNTGLCLSYLKSVGLAESNGDFVFFPEAVISSGSKTSSADRVKLHREKVKEISLDNATEYSKPPKTNAERQRAFRAKQKCEEQHIPMVDDYSNRQRYGGNYFIVAQRDRYRCAICGSTENLCVHHIDGYDPQKPENNEENKLILLCRKCHSQVHAKSLEIPQDALDAIGYGCVTKRNVTCNTEIEKELEIDKEIDIYISSDSDIKNYSKPLQSTPNDIKTEWFEQWWKLYPRKTGKAKCRTKFLKVCASEEMFNAMLEKLKEQVDVVYSKREMKFIPLPETYLNQGRWEDEVSPDNSKPLTSADEELLRSIEEF